MCRLAGCSRRCRAASQKGKWSFDRVKVCKALLFAQENSNEQSKGCCPTQRRPKGKDRGRGDGPFKCVLTGVGRGGGKLVFCWGWKSLR